MMEQTIIKAQNITLYDLELKFGLSRLDDDNFFPEWQSNLPEISEGEKQLLDQIKREYQHLSKYPLLEPLVKMVVLSPLLRMAGFYQPPFYISAEKEVKITSEDEGIIINGKIDILVFHPDFWVTVIEAKRAEYSLESAIPQTLAYMLANHDMMEKPNFGFVTNGGEFRFLKMIKQDKLIYTQSHLFSLDRGDDLYTVVRILKHFAQVLFDN